MVFLNWEAYWVNILSELVCKAKELVQAYKLQNVVKTADNFCSCLKLDRNTDVSYSNMRKAASWEDLTDNYLFYPKAVDLQYKDLRHFQWHWEKGEPVIVSNVLECTSGLSWEPLVMWRALRHVTNTKHGQHLAEKTIDCLDWTEVCLISQSLTLLTMESFLHKFHSSPSFSWRLCLIV